VFSKIVLTQAESNILVEVLSEIMSHDFYFLFYIYNSEKSLKNIFQINFFGHCSKVAINKENIEFLCIK
jgi:hypothetical protein